MKEKRVSLVILLVVLFSFFCLVSLAKNAYAENGSKLCNEGINDIKKMQRQAAASDRAGQGICIRIYRHHDYSGFHSRRRQLYAGTDQLFRLWRQGKAHVSGTCAARRTYPARHRQPCCYHQ